jgi:hypothetical protein
MWVSEGAENNFGRKCEEVVGDLEQITTEKRTRGGAERNEFSAKGSEF